MRAFWRGDKPLRSHAEWRDKLGKNSRQGTSAPTLAAVWGGPVELMGALGHLPEFEGLRLTELVVEAQSSVDEFSGPRNHDLVARGELPGGECVVICVEAKAGESFGSTVKRQTSAAARAKSVAEKNGKTSNAPERLKGLLERFVNYPTSEPRVQNMRYRLDLEALAAFPRPVYYALGGLSNPDYFGTMAERLGGLFGDYTLDVFEECHHFDPPHRAEPERLAARLRELWERVPAATG